MYVCLSATLRLNISEIKGARGLVTVGAYRKVAWCKQVVTLPMTSHDPMMSYS